jgi:hypothetical protein
LVLEAVRRDLVELRFGFLATVFLVSVRTRVVFAFVFAERFFVVEVFFFGGADARFAFRVVPVVRFLAAPIAAPDSAPITVPTTGTPRAVPATAPATAPPIVLPAVPFGASAASPSFSLSTMFLPMGEQNTLSFESLPVNNRSCVIHVTDSRRLRLRSPILS